MGFINYKSIIQMFSINTVQVIGDAWGNQDLNPPGIQYAEPGALH